jgi:hypothetical protein
MIRWIASCGRTDSNFKQPRKNKSEIVIASQRVARASKAVIARLDRITQYPRAEAIAPEGRRVLDPALSFRFA